MRPGPFTDLLLLGWGKVILDVECLPDLLGSLPLDHVGYSLACNIEESLGEKLVLSIANKQFNTDLDVQVVSGEDQLEQSALVHLEEVSVPGADVVCPLLLVLVILGKRWIVLVVSGPLKHLLQDGGVNIGKWNGLVVILARRLEEAAMCSERKHRLRRWREYDRLSQVGRHLCRRPRSKTKVQRRERPKARRAPPQQR